MHCLLPLLAIAQTGGITLSLPDGDHYLSRTTLESLAVDTLRHSFHGRAPETFTGAAINRLFDVVGVETRGLRGAELQAYVIVDAADGYRVVFGTGEMDPSTTGRTMLLAHTENGTPLAPEYGPWQLIVPGDHRGARSIRQVTRIRLVRALAPNREDARAAIGQQGRAFSAAYVANDTATLGAVYADSAVLMPPGRTIRGRDAIQRYFHWQAPYRQVAHAMEPARLRVIGDMAVEEGTWTSTGRRGEADPVTSSERYLLVWARERDGVWRIVYDMWHRPQPQD